MNMVGMYLPCTLMLTCHIKKNVGMEHKLQFACCRCEPLAITLARAELWPASPSNPHYAFSFPLLDWAEALLLECQVCLKDFCNALKFMSTFQMSRVSVLGSHLRNTGIANVLCMHAIIWNNYY